MNINGIAVASLQAGMTLKETFRFIENTKGFVLPSEIRRQIQEERRLIRKVTRSRALGF